MKTFTFFPHAHDWGKKLMAVLFVLSLLFLPIKGFTQCSLGSRNTSNTINVAGWSVGSSTSVYQQEGTYFVIENTLPGATYRITNCGSGYDTQLSIYDWASSTYLAYNDDGNVCGAGVGPAALDYYATASYPHIDVQFNRYPCTGSTWSTIYISMISYSPPCSGASQPSYASASVSGPYSASLWWGSSSGTSTITYYWNIYTSGGSWVTGSSTTGTSASTSSLSPNTTYYYTVYANNCGGNSASQTSGYFTTYPTDPSSISISTNPVCSGSGTSLTANGAQGTVYWYTGSCGSTYIGNGNPITVYPSSNTTYYARNYNGNWSSGCASTTVSVNQPATVPASPAVSNIGTSTADISWSASSGTAPITYYYVIGTSSTVTYGSGVVQGSTSSTSASVSGLAPGTTYYLRVYANNTCGNSAYATSSAFTMLKLNQSITFDALPPKTYGNSSFNPGATASSGLTVSYSSSNTAVATVSGSNINIVGAGTSTITASQSGNSTYNAATSVPQLLTVDKAPALTVTADNKSKTYGASEPTLTYTASGTLYNGDTYSVISGVSLSTATGAAATYGTHTITAASGTAANYYLNFVNGTLTVNKASLNVVNAVAQDKIYDTNTDAVIAGAQLSGVAYSGNVILGNETSGTFAQAAVGEDIAVSTAMIISGDDAFNYNLIQPSYLTADIVPGPLHHFTVNGISDPVMAGVASTVTVKAYDFYDNLKTNYTGTISFSSDDPIASLPANYTFTSGDAGSKTFTNQIILQTTGDHYVKVSDGSVQNQQSDISVTPAALSHFTVTTQHSGSETAGTAFSVTAVAYDLYNNIKTDYSGAKNVQWSTTATASGNGTNPVMIAAGNQNFVSGSATISGFKLYNAHETPTITITETAEGKTGTTAPITVNWVALANFLVSTGISQTAGVPFDITVTARDQYYNTVKNYAGNINFKSSNNAVVSFPSGNQPMSGYNGTHTFSNAIVINPVGTYWLRAADAAIPVITGTQYNVVVNPAAFNAGQSTLTVDYNTRYAGETVIATITPRDAFGNLLGAGKAVTAYLDGNGSDYNGPIAVTDHGNGTYTASIRVTSTTAANVISAAVAGSPVTQTQTITVLPAVVSLTTSVITTSTATMTVDETCLVNVQLKDQFGNNLTASAGTITLSTSLGSIGTIHDHADGSYWAVLSSTAPGTATISGQLDGSAMSDDAVVTINEGMPSYNMSSITPNPATITTDESSIITLQLKDQYGNDLHTSRGVAVFYTTLGSLTAVTDHSNGTYTATLSGDNTGTGTATITANLDGVNMNNHAEVLITEGLPALSQITVDASPASMTTDESSNITVQLKDQFGNLLTTSRGIITMTTTLGALSAVTDNNDGTYSAILSGNNSGTGTATISGKLDGSAIADQAQVLISDGAPDLSVSTVTALPATITTDQSSTITVQLKDQFGNNISTSRGIVTLNTNLGVLTAVTDNNDGSYTAILSGNESGTGIATISAALNGDALAATAEVTITEGLPALSQILVTADPAAITADETSLVTIQLRDQFGNILTHSGGVITLNTTLGALSAVTDHNNGTYTAVLSPDYSGTGTAVITAKLDGSDILSSASVDITWGVAVALNIATQPSSTAIAGIAFNQQPVIRIEDRYGNLVADDNSTEITAFANGTAALGGTLLSTAVNGIVSFNDFYYEIAETITLDFSATGFTTVTSAAIVVSPAPAAYFTLSSPADIIAGDSKAAYTVSRYDEFGNAVTAGSQNVYLYTSSTGSNALFYDGPAGSVISQVQIADGSSSASFWYYDEKSGIMLITASDSYPLADGLDGIEDASDDIYVGPAAIYDFYVSGIANPHDYGEYQSVSVTARDRFQNTKTDYLGTITFQITDADALSPADYTFQPSDQGQVDFINQILFSDQGTFWVTVLDLNDPQYYGYQADIVVNKRPLTITAINMDKVYGTSVQFDSTAFTVTGSLAPGESITSVSLTCSGIAEDADAGYYDIIPSNAIGNGGFLASNYEIIYSTAGTLTVSPATLNVTADAGLSKIYGAADPAFTYQLSGFVAEDDASVMSGNLGRAAGEDAGTYAITTGTLSAGNNYSISFTSADFQINPKNLTITALSGQSKVYGATDPLFDYSVSGFEFSDDISVITGIAGRTAGENTGTYEINAGTLNAGINYTYDFIPADFSITPKTLTIAPTAGQSKIYGDTDPVFTYSATGFEFADDASIFTGSLTRDTGENIGLYNILAGDLSAGPNYNLSFNEEIFEIILKTLVVTADPGQGKIFGQDDPALTYYASGFANDDDYSIFSGSLHRAAGENAGTYGIDLGSLNAGSNYAIAFNPDIFTITSREIVVIADAGLSKIYGSDDPDFTYTYSPALMGTDEFTGALARQTGEDAGVYSIGAGTLSAGPNYDVVVISSDFTILPFTVYVNANPGQGKVYGQADPVFTYYYSPDLLFGDEFSGSLERTPGESAGSYPINAGTLSAGGNYEIIFTSADFTITSKSITVTADAGQSKVYGDPDPVYTYTVDPALQAGDQLNGSLDRNPGENAGTYTLGIGSLNAGDDYIINFVPASFSIQPRTLVLDNFSAPAKTYDGTVTAPGASFADNRVSGDDLNFSYTAHFVDENAGTAKTVNFTGIALSGGSDRNNYNLVTNSGNTTANINPRVLNLIGFAASDKVYDGTTSVSGTGFVDDRVPGDLISFTVTAAFTDKNVGTEKTVEYTAINISGGADRYNYVLASHTGTATADILPRPLNVTLHANDKVYDGTTNANILFTDDRVPGDHVGYVYDSARFADKNVGTAKTITIYDLEMGSGDDMGNYEVNETPAEEASEMMFTTASILPKDLSIQAEDVSRCYDGTAHSTGYSVTYNGFVAGEDATVLNNSLSYSGPAMTAINAGQYNIEPSGYTADNYNIIYQPGELTILPAPQATISGTDSICMNAPDALITLSGNAGTAPYTFTYSLNSGTAEQIVSGSGDMASIAQSSSISGDFEYKLISVSDANGCVMNVNSASTITILPAVPAPYALSSQQFCNQGTVADLQAAGSSILWYDAASNGNVLSGSDALINGNFYYAAQQLNGCESSDRTEVFAAVLNPAVPTGSDLQSFCNAASVGELTANGNGILWYDSPSGGTALDAFAAITNGAQYYAAASNSGCESTSRFEVTAIINSSSASTETVSACDSYQFFGNTLSESGRYTHTLNNAVGCDSVVTLYLTLQSSTYAVLEPVVCDSYLSPAGNVYTVSGVYNEIIPNAGGCDSVITINLTVETCTGINPVSAENIRMYPNPVSDHLTLEGVKDAVIEVSDVLGNIVISTKANDNTVIINTNNLTTGVYFVRVKNSVLNSVQKIEVKK
jgi:hypothetical protein